MVLPLIIMKSWLANCKIVASSLALTLQLRSRVSGLTSAPYSAAGELPAPPSTSSVPLLAHETGYTHTLYTAAKLWKVGGHTSKVFETFD